MQKAKLFIAWIVVQAYALGRGKADKIRNPPRRFLVVQLAKLGDIVCATPVPAAIKARYPSCTVTVISTKINQAVLAHNPHVDTYLVYNRNFFALVRQIRRQKFDGACLLIPNFIGLLFLYFGKIAAITAPRVVGGFCPYQTFYYRSLLHLVLSIPHRMGHYAPGEYLQLLKPWGISASDTFKHLGFSASAGARATSLLVENGAKHGELLVGISPSAGNKIKCWEPKNFGAVANYVAKQYGATIVIIGTPNDKAEANAMLSVIPAGTKVINTVGLLNIDELKALISTLHLFISVDSGPIYIAEAFRVATIDIVGPMDENEQPPRGSRHKIVKVDRVAPVLHIMNARVYDREEARRQIEQVSPSMVYSQIDGLLAQSR